MDRHAAIAAALLAVTVGAAAAKKTPAKKSSASGRMAPSLRVRSVDFARRLVLVEVSGAARVPQPNLFTFTDERGRHYVAQSAQCDPPFPSGTRACQLEIPSGYERHPLTRLELHLRGLHSRTVAAPEEEVASAWRAGIATAHPAGPDGGVDSDGGAPDPRR
jgi:hypothetical protein